jgi:hypothetical protein
MSAKEHASRLEQRTLELPLEDAWLSICLTGDPR